MQFCLYPCIHAYMSAYIHTCTHVHICMHIKNIIMYVSLHTYLDTYINSCMFAYIHTYVFLPAYICTSKHTYMMHANLLTCIDSCCLASYKHMYIPTYLWMSGCINMDVNTYMQTYIHKAILPTYIHIQ